MSNCSTLVAGPSWHLRQETGVGEKNSSFHSFFFVPPGLAHFSPRLSSVFCTLQRSIIANAVSSQFFKKRRSLFFCSCPAVKAAKRRKPQISQIIASSQTLLFRRVFNEFYSILPHFSSLLFGCKHFHHNFMQFLPLFSAFSSILVKSKSMVEFVKALS